MITEAKTVQAVDNTTSPADETSCCAPESKFKMDFPLPVGLHRWGCAFGAHPLGTGGS